MNKPRRAAFVVLMLFVGSLAASPSQVPGATLDDVPEAKRIAALLRQPEDKIDFAKAKLTIDKMIDPSVDIDANLKRIDGIVAQIQAMAGSNATSAERISALRKYLYEPGSWNGYEIYHYDFDDPLGRKIRNKLISNYMATKKGQCVSMPLLFIVLGQRLGLDVAAAITPEHVFVKYTDDAGITHNLEATSGATPARDVWIRQQTPMTDQAVANGTYMRKLSKRETVAAMAQVLAEHFAERNAYEKEIAVADAILGAYPKTVDAMLHKGSAYTHLIRTKFEARYPSPRDIPNEERPYFRYLSEQSESWYSKAESLGWRQPTKMQEMRYVENVNRAKLAQ